MNKYNIGNDKLLIISPIALYNDTTWRYKVRKRQQHDGGLNGTQLVPPNISPSLLTITASHFAKISNSRFGQDTSPIPPSCAFALHEWWEISFCRQCLQARAHILVPSKVDCVQRHATSIHPLAWAASGVLESRVVSASVTWAWTPGTSFPTGQYVRVWYE
jgi:hypothetical protein